MKSIKDYIITIPNFPEEGVMFRDITGIIENPHGYKLAINELTNALQGINFDALACIESRGFIFGAPLAYELSKIFIPVRKKGKLPRETASKEYSLEYGTAAIEIHKDSVKQGMKVVLIDDLIATGGTLKASAELIEELGGEVIAILSLIELEGLNGRELLKDYNVITIAKYEGI